MRMRKKHNLAERMERVVGLMIAEPRELKGSWHTIAGGRELRLEIGCGKGRFALETARGNPGVFLIAVELEPNALVVAMEAAARENLTNLRFISADAATLEAFFAPAELALIYLNFSDPWPHASHRRLTDSRFLTSYRRVLADGGAVRFKTDNAALFEWSLEEFRRCGWTLQTLSRDLHGDALDGGAVTEYEERFMALGTPINYLEALPPDGSRAMNIELRDVRSSDEIAVLCRLAARLWREHYTPIIGKRQVAYMLDKFQSEEAVAAQICDGYVYKLLVADGEPAGYMAARRETNKLFLSKLYIDKRMRGHGFSRLMLDECVRLADGLEAIYLTCNKHNTETHKAYAKLGFLRTGEVVTDIGGSYVMDDYIFDKPLIDPDCVK